MASLYENGWRQGSITEVELLLDAIILGTSGQPERSSTLHHHWIVATQDCDLDRADADAAYPTIELRPLFTEDCPTDWGIRSAKLRLTGEEYSEANSPRVTVAPNVLTEALASGAVRRDVSFSRRQAFTTWLGLRYDRPAVPNHLVPLAQRIGKEVARSKHRESAARVRDVLVQFDDSHEPTRYSLIAVLDDAVDEADVRAWLARVSQAVPTDLGVADRIEAADSNGIAFSTIESSYAADVSQVTWGRDEPEPEGAT
jgi:hypothetical protein